MNPRTFLLGALLVLLGSPEVRAGSGSVVSRAHEPLQFSPTAEDSVANFASRASAFINRLADSGSIDLKCPDGSFKLTRDEFFSVLNFGEITLPGGFHKPDGATRWSALSVPGSGRIFLNREAGEGLNSYHLALHELLVVLNYPDSNYELTTALVSQLELIDESRKRRSSPRAREAVEIWRNYVEDRVCGSAGQPVEDEKSRSNGRITIKVAGGADIVGGAGDALGIRVKNSLVRLAIDQYRDDFQGSLLPFLASLRIEENAGLVTAVNFSCDRNELNYSRLRANALLVNFEEESRRAISQIVRCAHFGKLLM